MVDVAHLGLREIDAAVRGELIPYESLCRIGRNADAILIAVAEIIIRPVLPACCRHAEMAQGRIAIHIAEPAIEVTETKVERRRRIELPRRLPEQCLRLHGVLLDAVTV